MSPRTCPVKGCGRALGTTRGGDPLLMCNAHYHSLSRTQQQRLWQSYKAWKRLERQRLRLKAEIGEVPRALLLSIAAAVSGYIEVRNDCIASHDRAGSGGSSSGRAPASGAGGSQDRDLGTGPDPFMELAQ